MHPVRAVASLTVPGGQEFHFPHFFLKFRSIFPQTSLIFFLILALRVGESPTREGPGYATASSFLMHGKFWIQNLFKLYKSKYFTTLISLASVY